MCELSGITTVPSTCMGIAGQMHDAAEVLPTLLDSLSSFKQGHSLVNRVFSFSLEVKTFLA